MSRPLPDWLPRARAMKHGEIIIQEDTRSYKAVRWNLTKHIPEGTYKVRVQKDGQFKIERKA